MVMFILTYKLIFMIIVQNLKTFLELQFLLCGPVFYNFSASVESLAVDLKFCQTT